MKFVSFAFFGPSHGESQYYGNWTRRVYEHEDVTLYVDRHRELKYVEVFIPTDCGLWCAGTFNLSYRNETMTWAGTERKAELVVDQWINERKTDDLLRL